MDSSFLDNSNLNQNHSPLLNKKRRFHKNSVCVKSEPQDVAEFVASGNACIEINQSQNGAMVKGGNEENCAHAKNQVGLKSANVLVFGPVLGQFKSFVHYLKNGRKYFFEKRNAQIDACFCVGPFFHDHISLEEQAKELLSGCYALPLPFPVYFFDKGRLPRGVKTCDYTSLHDLNLFYLTASDGVGDLVYLLNNRLCIAFTSPNFSFCPNTILEQKCKDATYKGCDFLITSEWGRGIIHMLDLDQQLQNPQANLKKMPDDLMRKLSERESLDVSRVALLVRPRFHITPSSASLDYCYFQTPSFQNITLFSSTSLINHSCKGFYSLGCCSSKIKRSAKGIGQFSFIASIYPINEMTPCMATKISDEITPQSNPYRTYAQILKYSSMPRDSYPEDAQYDAGNRPSEHIPCLNGHSNLNGAYDALENEAAIHDHSHRIPNRSSPSTSRSFPQQKTIPSLITYINYDTKLYEEPILHDLIRNGQYKEAVIRICNKTNLMKKGKEMLEVKSFSSFGNLPIHCLLDYENITNQICGKKRLKLLKLLLSEYPEGAMTRAWLCQPQANEPRSVGTTDLPLSLACQPCIKFSGECPDYSLSISDADNHIIRLLARTYPAATKVKYNETGRSVLHYLLEHRPSLGLVRFIVEISKTAEHASDDNEAVFDGSILQHCDKDKQLPIHTAIQYYAPCDVVKYLIQEFPPGLYAQMCGGDLPLHCAANWGCLEDVLTLLLEGYPGAVVERNLEGSTPIELVILNNELWIPSFDIPEVACDDKTKELIITCANGQQIPPENLMPPFRMLINMVEACDKFQRRKSSQHDKGIKKIQAILKANSRELWKNVQLIRERLCRSEKSSRKLDHAEAYLRYIIDEGCIPP